jgi:pimeloyl-ACP methyl ester carboxylesterase
MINHYVRSNGLTLFCREHPGGEPTVVLLPGLTVSGAFFEALIGAGLNPRFRTVALDLRGRGRSDAPTAGLEASAPTANYTMGDHAADVLAALDGLRIRCPVLVGHSFGGMLALYLAAHTPSRFPRVVVLDAAIALANPATRELLRPTLDRLDTVKPSWGEYLEALRRQPYFHDWWDPAIETYFRDDVWIDSEGSVRSRARPEAIRAAVDGLLAVDWPDIVSKVAQPVLLVNAADPFGPPGSPPFLPHAAAKATAEALPNGRCVVVPGNHITMAFGTNAHSVVEAIADFIACDGADKELANGGESLPCASSRAGAAVRAVGGGAAEALIRAT